MPERLTESLEDYLEAIAELIEIEGHAHTKEIAVRLNVKMPSVTGALRQLEKMGLIIYNTHYPVLLTAEGKVIADDVIKRHKVLTKFFSDVLGLPLAKASETACHLEHVVDADTIRRFVLCSETIENRRDAGNLQTYLAEAMSFAGSEKTASFRTLDSFVRGNKVFVERFGGNLAGREPDFPRVGEKLVFDGSSLDRKSFRVITETGKRRYVPCIDAENIWCRKLK